jgi:flagellar biosynthesis GTPase FlhF
VIHEIIPVAVNVNYDVKRLNKVYARRTFTEVLSLGEVDALLADTKGKSKYDNATQEEIAAELKAAITGLFGEQMSMSITPQEEELATP